MNGIGPVLIWHLHPKIDIDLAGGFTAYNGGKLGFGTKIYPLKSSKANLFLGAHYSLTTGKRLITEPSETYKENYRTFPNHYLIGTTGVWIKGDYLQHFLSIGYAGILAPYVIEEEEGNVEVPQHLQKIKNGLAGGISATYTISINLDKLSFDE